MASASLDDRVALLHQIVALPTEERLAIEMDACAPYFDPEFYRAAYGLAPGADPQVMLRHYCEIGWKELWQPCQPFDGWWYRIQHFEPADPEINPLLHYALVGSEAGLATAPQCVPPVASAALTADRPLRRAALFAGFEASGTLSEAAWAWVNELARHGDVFYCSDGPLDQPSLDRLATVAEVVLAQRHEAYDFGSWSALVAEIGWDRLMEYDEVLFVNDSTFLLGPLDHTLATMAERPCSWWGMQATELHASPNLGPSVAVPIHQGRGTVQRLREPIPIVQGEGALAEIFNEQYTDFHLGSYFLAFRRPVLADPLFRALIDMVEREPSKNTIIRKYEVGLSRLLIGEGHRFETVVPGLYPFHPVVSDYAFDLIARGMPVLKRSLFTENIFNISDLRWYRKKVEPYFPDAPFDLINQVAR